MTEYLIANIGGIGSIALHSHNTLTWSAKLEVETPHGVEFGYQNMNIFDSSFEDERVGFSLKLRKKSSTDLRMRYFNSYKPLATILHSTCSFGGEMPRLKKHYLLVLYITFPNFLYISR